MEPESSTLSTPLSGGALEGHGLGSTHLVGSEASSPSSMALGAMAGTAADSAISSAAAGSVLVAPGGGGTGGGRAGGDGGDGRGDGDGAGGGPSNPFAALAASAVGYFANRARADPDFWFKMLAECGNDAAIILCVNWTARGKRFWKELEFVLCHLTVSLLCDVALVSMLAPTVSSCLSTPTGLRRTLNGLPANIFEPGSLLGKAGCLVYKGILYGAVGAGMGFLGTRAVTALTDVKEAVDPAFVPPAMMQDAYAAGVGWLVFMGVSSNIRYQMLAGSEKYLYAAFPGLVSKSASIGLRFANNIYGSAQWIRIANNLGVSKPRAVIKSQGFMDSMRDIASRPGALSLSF